MESDVNFTILRGDDRYHHCHHHIGIMKEELNTVIENKSNIWRISC